MEWNIFEIKNGRRVDLNELVDGDDGYYIEGCNDLGDRDVCGPYATEEEADNECERLNSLNAK
jgi:hypothetical protein